MGLSGESGKFYLKQHLSSEQVDALIEQLEQYGFFLKFKGNIDAIEDGYSYGNEQIFVNKFEFCATYAHELNAAKSKKYSYFSIEYDITDPESDWYFLSGSLEFAINPEQYTVTFGPYVRAPLDDGLREAYYSHNVQLAKDIVRITDPFFGTSGDWSQGENLWRFKQLNPFVYPDDLLWERYHYFSNEIVSTIGKHKFEALLIDAHRINVEKHPNGAFSIDARQDDDSGDSDGLYIRSMLGLGEPVGVWQEIANYENQTAEEVTDFFYSQFIRRYGNVINWD